jgi:hypothetical protein
MSTDYWKEFEKLSSQCAETTKADNPLELDLFYRGFSAYREGIPLIPTSLKGDRFIVQVALLCHNLHTLKALADLAITGNYISSVNLIKNIYENWLAFNYVATFPNESRLWLDARSDRRPPKAETMRNKLPVPDPSFREILKEIYTEVNRFSHTDPVTVLSRLEQHESTILIDVNIKYKQAQFKACAYYMILWVGVMLESVASLIPESHSWHVLNSPLLQQIDGFVKETKNEE